MTKRVLFPLAIVAVLGLTGCGKDDGSGARSSASASGSGSGTADASCDEVGDPGSADSSLDVTLDDFTVTPSEDSVIAGSVAFNLTNDADQPHEFLVAKAGSADDLQVSNDVVDTDALGDDFIGEVEPFPPGDCAGAFDLDAGHYVLFCNLPGHFDQGMHAEIDVVVT